MLVWFEDNLEEVCEGQCNDFPPFLSLLALNINIIFCGNLILEPLRWYCIDYPKWGDIFLIRVPSNNHHSSLQMVVFFPYMELVFFSNWTICVKFCYHEIKAYVHYGG
jgi:hypothetical protein